MTGLWCHKPTHTHFPFNFPDFRPIERRLEATEGPENVPTIVGVLSLLVERGLKTESEREKKGAHQMVVNKPRVNTHH